MDFGGNEFEKNQEKDALAKLMEVQIGDRVCVMNTKDALVKGRVASVNATGDMIVVTLSKHSEPIAYARHEVFLLYRYVQSPFGEVAMPLCLHQQNS